MAAAAVEEEEEAADFADPEEELCREATNLLFTDLLLESELEESDEESL